MSRHASLLLGLLSGLLAACSSGSDSPAPVAPGCEEQGTQQGSGEAMCLVSCNLGCTQSGCSINQIAQNQPIILVFSRNVDPATVNASSVSFRTSTGEEPVGRYIVNGNVVTFVPQVRISGAQTFFGFRASENYLMTLPGGANEINALRSTSGDRLARTYTCSLSVTLGVVDLDGSPPRAQLVSPPQLTNVSPSTPIVLEFSELISAAPFIGASLQNSPITVSVIRQTGGSCDRQMVPIQMAGQWQLFNDPIEQVTRATFSPVQSIPATACVQINVTNRVEDLAGTPSPGEFFEYQTTSVQQPPQSIEEPFDNDLNLDFEFSSGTWSNGEAKPGILGWDGLHGDFNAQDGTPVGANVFEWSTDDQLVPRSRTLSGKDERVTDGVFRFSRFELPRGITVRFVGSNPARIFVRGKMELDGTIDVSGDSPPVHIATNAMGQAGAAGGPAGGAGGRGGDRGNGTGNLPRFNGQAGEDVQLPGGHAFAGQEADTGGKGSIQFPTSGMNSAITFNGPFGVISVMIAAGGGGAGFGAAGEAGQAVETYQGNTGDLGPASVPGKMFQLYPVPAGEQLLDHMMAGGSGGGGGGSHPYRSQPSLRTWLSGGGGAGGGGAVALRVGGDFEINTGGLLLALGGDTPDSSANNLPTPGGAGSGGSVLLQAGGATTMDGLVDVSGGSGGQSLDTSFSTSTPTRILGGDAGHGYIRFETTAAPDPALLGTTLPTPSASNGTVGVFSLTESDAVVGSQSLWNTLNLVFPPSFLRYEVEAIVDGQRQIFSDDPSVGPIASGSTPVRFFAQGAELDSQNQVNTNEVTPWHSYVGPFAPPGEGSIASSSKSVRAVRFVILFDRSMANDVSIDKVSVWYQP